MNVALVVIGDGRGPYLAQTMKSIKEHVLYPLRARIMVNDEADPAYIQEIDSLYFDFIRVHTGRVGMAGAVQAGFSEALSWNPDYVLWVEEDMELINKLPIADALEALQNNDHLAQIMFKREPVEHPLEQSLGDVLAATVQNSEWSEVRPTYTAYNSIFSLNPCLIPRRVLEIGWPSGPLGIGNETGFTKKLLAAGYHFGCWGHVGDPALVRHIGAHRTDTWSL